jgi:predicted DNA-binding WGR domain protein
MSVLKTMSFVAVQRAANATPEQQRRNKLLVHLREQKAIAVADSEGRLHTVKKRRWELTEDGDKFQIEIDKRLKRWWQATDKGIALSVKWGNRAFEFEKGKTAIQVEKAEQLPAVFDNLILAAANGEFDKFIAEMNKQRVGFKKRAA